jgi:glycerol-3-phosphate acyltransferase PlsY
VATALGGLIALSSCLGLSVIAIWISSVLVFRISSLASLVTAFLAPVVAWILLEPTYAGYVMIMSGFLIMRHHQNIKRLWRGEEPRLW